MVQLFDVNGPPGGIDKHCELHVMLNRLVVMLLPGMPGQRILTLSLA